MTHSVIIQEDTVVAVKFAIVYCWVKACTEVINRLRSLVLMPTMLHLSLVPTIYFHRIRKIVVPTFSSRLGNLLVISLPADSCTAYTLNVCYDESESHPITNIR